jgi:hypothetical protein
MWIKLNAAFISDDITAYAGQTIEVSDAEGRYMIYMGKAAKAYPPKSAKGRKTAAVKPAYEKAVASKPKARKTKRSAK